MVIFIISVSRNNRQPDTDWTDSREKELWSHWLKMTINAAVKGFGRWEGLVTQRAQRRSQGRGEQSSLSLLSGRCSGDTAAARRQAITLPDIAIYSSLTPNDYCTPLMHSVIFSPDSAGFKWASWKNLSSLALLGKNGQKGAITAPYVLSVFFNVVLENLF